MIHAPTCINIEYTMLYERDTQGNILSGYIYVKCPEQANSQ